MSVMICSGLMYPEWACLGEGDDARRWDVAAIGSAAMALDSVSW